MTPVENFIRNENIKNFRKRLEAPTDDTQRDMLVTLLAEEEATLAGRTYKGKLELP
jgi:hypothetical protein